MLQRSGQGAQEDFANFVRKMKVLDSVLGSQTDYSFQYDLQVPKEGCPVLRRDSLALCKNKRHLFRRHTSHPMVAYTQGRKVMAVRVDETLPSLPVFSHPLYTPESLATFPILVLPFFPPFLADEFISTASFFVFSSWQSYLRHLVAMAVNLSPLAEQ